MSESLTNMPSQLIPAHIDGWYNVVTGMGLQGFDKRVHTSFALNTVLDDQTLIDLYRAEGLATKIINIPIEDMIRKWFYIETDSEGTIVKYLNKKGIKKQIKSALKWGDLFGGSVLYIGIDDGRDAEEPVNEEAILDIKFFEVYDKRSITWGPDDLYNNPKEAKYGKPKIYTINNPTTGQPFQVHESRLLRFDGRELPDIEVNRNRGWNDSMLQSIVERLTGVCDSLCGVENINTDFILGVLKVSNLQALLGSREGEQKLQDRIKAMDLVKHILNTIVIDKNEEYERISSIGVSGLRELIDVLIDVVCGMTGIPRVKLIGDQSKGIGGGAEGNIRLYYDDIAARQEDDLYENLIKLVRYAAKSKACGFKGNTEDLPIVFNTLWQPTMKEIAETRLLNAKADSVYVELGLPIEYVLLSRFGGQSYSNDLTLPKEYVLELKKLSVIETIKKNMETILKPGSTGEDNPSDEEEE
jgi:hypothetical protein